MCLDLAHFFKQYQLLTLIWLGFLGVGFEMRGGKITPCLKLARIILEWLYVIIMSRTRFRVNPHSIVAWMSRNSLLKAGARSEV